MTKIHHSQYIKAVERAHWEVSKEDTETSYLRVVQELKRRILSAQTKIEKQYVAQYYGTSLPELEELERIYLDRVKRSRLVTANDFAARSRDIARIETISACFRQQHDGSQRVRNQAARQFRRFDWKSRGR